MVNVLNLVLAMAVATPALAQGRGTCVLGRHYCGEELINERGYTIDELLAVLPDPPTVPGPDAERRGAAYDSLFTCTANSGVEWYQWCRDSAHGRCNKTITRPPGEEAICGSDL